MNTHKMIRLWNIGILQVHNVFFRDIQNQCKELTNEKRLTEYRPKLEFH